MPFSRYSVIPGLFAAILGFGAGAQRPPDGVDQAPDVTDAADMPMAPTTSLESELDTSLPPPPVDLEPQRGTIFDEIKIELMDLQRLGQEVNERLGGENVRMSLDESIRLAIENNPDIIVSSYDPMIANADLMAARGEFDPLLAGSLRYNYASISANPQTVAFGGITQTVSRQSSGSISLSGKTHWGTEYQVTLDTDREIGTFTNFMKDFSGGVTVTLTQPILRGRGRDTQLLRIRTARNNRLSAESDVEATVMSTIGDVVKAYWDLVGALEALQVRQEALDNAQRLVDINERRLEIGTGAAIEVLQAKAGVATRQSDFITARTAIRDAEDALKNLLNMRDGELFSRNRIIPTDRPSIESYPLDEERSLRSALELRPEIHRAQFAVANAELSLKQSNQNLLPQLDAGVSYRTGGRNTTIHETYDGIRERQDEIWTFTVQGSVPIGNRAARGAFDRARYLMRQAEHQLDRTRQEVMLRVRLATTGVISSEIQVESNRQATRLQEASVKAEEQRLRLGTSTAQRVLDIQEDFTGAQVQLLQAEIGYEKSLIDLQVAEGTLLRNLGIELETPEDHERMGFLESIVPTVSEPEFLKRFKIREK